MKTLVLANQKGGVGKSAIATQLAHYLHRLGRSVIVVDLDHQPNTSRPLQAYSDVAVAGFSSSAVFEAVSLPALNGAFCMSWTPARVFVCTKTHLAILSNLPQITSVSNRAVV